MYRLLPSYYTKTIKKLTQISQPILNPLSVASIHFNQLEKERKQQL